MSKAVTAPKLFSAFLFKIICIFVIRMYLFCVRGSCKHPNLLTPLFICIFER